MGQRLLLVDSDRGFLKEHQVSLESAYDLEVTHAPDSVLSRLATGAFAAVLVCVEVAENKGYALCSTLRRQKQLEGVKIILISAKASEEEYRRHQSLKGHADLYLHKPIAPSALVAALAPFVPGRAIDPDNPLGELVDTELGDDWLDSLKSTVELPRAALETPVFGVRPEAPLPATQMEAKATAPPATSRTQLLDEQVQALHEELRAKDLRLQAAETELQQLHRQLNSVTLNLDELERSNREAETLKARLAETETSLRELGASKGRDGESVDSLKAQMREGLEERAGLIQQVESLNQQVGEKTQRAIELLKERDRLLHENLDLEPFREKARNLELMHAEALVAQEAVLAEKQQELTAALEAQNQLNTTLEALVEQHASLEGVHQAALLEVAGFKERVHTTQLEMAGLEATMRGQGRDLAELGESLRAAEAEREAARAQVLEREQQVQARQDLVQQHQEEIIRLSGQLAAVRQELDETKIQHEGERLEIMNGLDAKEAEILRLKQTLAENQEVHGALEREKQAVLSKLSEQRDRLENLDRLLQEVQEQLRRGADLARG